MIRTISVEINFNHSLRTSEMESIRTVLQITLTKQPSIPRSTLNRFS